MASPVAIYTVESGRSSTSPWDYFTIIFIVVLLASILAYGFGARRGREELKRSMRFRSRGTFGASLISGVTSGAGGGSEKYRKKMAGGCPNCHEPLPVGAELSKCPHCHWRLHNRDTKVIVDEEGKCPKCKNMVRAGVARCPFCAWRFDAAAPDPGRKREVGYVKRDVVIGGSVAFKEGELLHIEGDSPEVDRPAYRYVVNSNLLGRRFKLSDDELEV
jgi:hypothetical protein